MTKTAMVKETAKAIWPLVKAVASVGCVISSIMFVHSGNMPHATYMLVSAIYIGTE